MENDQRKEIISWVSPWLTPLVYTLANKIVLPFYFSKIDISGQENIPLTGAVIVAPTHRSRWDAIIVPCVTGLSVSGRHPRFMVMSTELEGFQGWLIRRLGGFPVDVDHPSLESIEYGIDILARGEMLVVFPEGGIFRDIHVHPIKRGVAKMALEALHRNSNLEMRILPISVKYTELFPKKGSPVTVKIGEAINVADYTDVSIRKGSQKLTKVLEENLRQLHEQKAEIASENAK